MDTIDKQMITRETHAIFSKLMSYNTEPSTSPLSVILGLIQILVAKKLISIEDLD